MIEANTSNIVMQHELGPHNIINNDHGKPSNRTSNTSFAFHKVPHT